MHSRLSFHVTHGFRWEQKLCDRNDNESRNEFHGQCSLLQYQIALFAAFHCIRLHAQIQLTYEHTNTAHAKHLPENTHHKISE